MSNYGTLKSQLETWLVRTNLEPLWEIVTTLAWTELMDRVRVRDMETEATITFDDGTGAEPLPNNFLSPVAIVRADVNTPKIDVVNSQTIRRSSLRALSEGVLLVAVEGSNLLAAPAPTATGPVDIRLIYHAAYTAPADDADTNWLFTNAYHVVFYAYAKVISQHLRDEKMEALYEKRLDQAIARMHRTNKAAKQKGGPRLIRFPPPDDNG